MTKKLIVSNWKNHPGSLAEAEQILESVDEYLGSLAETEKFGLVFCPPFVFTEEVSEILNTSHLLHQAELGAQDISTDDEVTLTGEISGLMLKKLGVSHVIVGHSERRWKLGESDQIVNKKLKTVLRNEMIPLVCLGEKLRDNNFKDFIKSQVETTFAGLSSDEVSRCIIAYEPVWAISTTHGVKPDSPESALESVGIIKETLAKNYKPENIKCLYGGSVTSINAREFLKNKGFDGVLIGGASVKKEEFIKILSVAAES